MGLQPVKGAQLYPSPASPDEEDAIDPEWAQGDFGPARTVHHLASRGHTSDRTTFARKGRCTGERITAAGLVHHAGRDLPIDTTWPALVKDPWYWALQFQEMCCGDPRPRAVLRVLIQGLTAKAGDHWKAVPTVVELSSGPGNQQMEACADHQPDHEAGRHLRRGVGPEVHSRPTDCQWYRD